MDLKITQSLLERVQIHKNSEFVGPEYFFLKNSRQTRVLRLRLPYRSLCTTRGSRPRNINHPHSDSSSHHSSYLGLTNHPHLQLIYTHTYKPHTHTDSLRSLDLPRLSPLSVFPFHSVFPGSYPCLVPRSSDTLLVTPTRTVSGL